MCQRFFERIFKVKFPKKRPEWLLNPISRGQMHLDGYNAQLKLAFELNGPQHYQMYPKYHKSHTDFFHQKELDVLKAELCKKQGIILIVVSYWLGYNEFLKHIIKEYTRLTGNTLKNIPKYFWSKFKRPDSNLK